MRVLVTGGCGFIGSHIVEELCRRGFEVYVIDDLSLGAKKNVNGMDVKLIVGSSGDVLYLNEKFDAVLHNGIPSSSPMYKRDPNLISKVLRDMISILEYSKKNGSKIVLASTSSIYNGNSIPWHENMPILVTDYYTEARYYCERLCKLYSDLYGVECIVLRYFSVYGEREEHKGSYANVLTQMIWCGLKNEEFVVYGDGSQARDLIYVKDVVEANIRALEYEDSKFEVFNVGSGRAYSFNDMLSVLRGHNLEVKAIYVENPIRNYVYCTLADTKKAEDLLKFKAKWRVEEIVPKLIDYYKNVIMTK
ncbi:MAG: NAD-dependent epimerase/dehydratase family protein [Candidatus Nezhaarchaeales archaeon]|nr:MAG: nucleoside-diphosphate sugar epimerase [Candidatus Nezhaarchaeota archaeon WYZ-LMO8]TDA37160.1 MAG: nucleoside-diphosphate sugar epimerase [Candidatus Nezhaarchaeota archaeon WYZ-LMO7]